MSRCNQPTLGHISSNHHCQTKHHMHVRNTSRSWGIDVLFVRLSYISLRIRFSTFHRKLIKEWRGKRFNRTHTPQFLYPNLLPIHHFVAHQCPSHHGWQAGVSSSHRIQLALFGCRALTVKPCRRNPTQRSRDRKQHVTEHWAV